MADGYALMEIRGAATADVEAIAGLLTELNREEGYATVSSAQDIGEALFGVSVAVSLKAFVALRANEIIGVLLYYPGYDTLSASYGFHLADIVVAQGHRHIGVGTALVRALSAQTLAEKKEWVSLTVLKRNQAARGFYAKLGMTEVAVDFFAIGKSSLAQL